MSDCCRIVIGDHSNEDEIAQVCYGQGMIITTPLSDLIYCAYSYLEYSDKRWYQRIKTLDWGSFVQLQAIYSSSSAINNTCPWPSTEIIAVWWPKVFANALLSSLRDKKELRIIQRWCKRRITHHHIRHLQPRNRSQMLNQSLNVTAEQYKD